MMLMILANSVVHVPGPFTRYYRNITSTVDCGLLETVSMVTDQNACNINNYANACDLTILQAKKAVSA